MKRKSTTTFALLVSLFIPIALFFLAADWGANTGAASSKTDAVGVINSLEFFTSNDTISDEIDFNSL